MPATGRRVVLACWGSYGDLFPYLALGVELGSLGHHVTIATCPYYRDLVTARNLDFCPVRPDVDPSDSEMLRRVMDPARGSEVVVRELMAAQVRGSFDDLMPAARRAEVLVSHPVTFAAPLVAESLRMPWISTVLAPTSMLSVHDLPLLPPHPAALRVFRANVWLSRLFSRLAHRATDGWVAPVKAFRAELGLAPAGHPLFEGQFSPHGTVALFSRVLGAPQADWPPRTVQSGFVFHDEGEMPAALLEFLDAGEPPIVFTLGSSAVGAAGSFYEQSVAAAERLGRRAVLLVGADERNRAGRPLPVSAIAVGFAPHGALFPRAAAVVHHGGIGTTAQALRAGQPMLVVPHAHDQPDNAFRVERLGVARVLDARRYRAARAATLLGDLLSNPAYARRAAAVRSVVAEEDGLGTACQAILAAAGVE